ncbi:MBL fold metallo-hydrolase [Streptomyces sp. NPDC056255]|uniref:MBL fold metallo-hydrolase n=1 Tax=Streptomyces sp. NPDC056255 TaxID=3345764 RepID=UPI0035E2CDE2
MPPGWQRKSACRSSASCRWHPSEPGLSSRPAARSSAGSTSCSCHLHPDHTGWAWHPAPGGDRLPFAHAAYLVSEAEWARRDLLGAQEIVGLTPRVRTVADGQEVFPGVRMRVTGGHSPGHAEYVITSGGQRLIAFGDALVSPIQVDHPGWSSSFDHDPAESAAHRRRLVAELAEPGTIGIGMHFADVVFGHVRRDGDHPAWRPLDA